MRVERNVIAGLIAIIAISFLADVTANFLH